MEGSQTTACIVHHIWLLPYHEDGFCVQSGQTWLGLSSDWRVTDSLAISLRRMFEKPRPLALYLPGSFAK